ncbi:MAG: hypothetical protein B6I38_03055 [Anaerolineaceae bacterium 4572_5.1]|nr:MAG: hypothetical protein B6I38_03055 [Anaerolineaceae bacterium 4572_5.1]
MSAEDKNPLALVIEDDPNQADIFSRAVERAGFAPEIIANGAQALERLEEVLPALVVLDIHLPNVSGDKILRHIRADERLKNIPVILATADPLLAETLNEESDLVLLKPIGFIQLSELAARLR